MIFLQASSQFRNSFEGPWTTTDRVLVMPMSNQSWAEQWPAVLNGSTFLLRYHQA